MTRSAFGMSVAHFGVGLFTLGVTIVSAFTVEADLSLSPGQKVEVAGYEFELRNLKNVQGPNYQALEGEIDIRKDGVFIGQVRPQKRTYLVQQSPMTEAGIMASWNRDLFVALGDPLGNDAWSVRLQYKPMIRLIWLGALVMALGGIAHRAIIKALGLRQASYKFGHAALHDVGPFQMLDSYHCSRYNTNTRRLTEEMFDAIFATARKLLKYQRCE